MQVIFQNYYCELQDSSKLFSLQLCLINSRFRVFVSRLSLSLSSPISRCRCSLEHLIYLGLWIIVFESILFRFSFPTLQSTYFPSIYIHISNLLSSLGSTLFRDSTILFFSTEAQQCAMSPMLSSRRCNPGHRTAFVATTSTRDVTIAAPRRFYERFAAWQ